MNDLILKPGDRVSFEIVGAVGKFTGYGVVDYADAKGTVRVRPDNALYPGTRIDVSTIKKVG